MLDNWVFLVAFIELMLGCIVYVFVAREQIKTLKHRSELQPLKRLLLGAVSFMALSSLPLAFVYANVIWLHYTFTWIVYSAVLLNASSHIVVAGLLLLVYRFKIDDDL